METSASLLERLRIAPDENAWRRLDDLYRPLIRKWLSRDPVLGDEAEDIAQEVMAVVVRELPDFQRQRTGSFRRWLRTITAHRVAAHFRSRTNRPVAIGDSSGECALVQLADPHSELSRLWDEEHNHYVLRRLMELVAPQFEPTSINAFRRVALDGIPPAAVAQELGLSLNAVLIAKSRILSKLRQEAEGLMD
jgi:RNA polymerase sigma factor (sigma-70 family)